MSLSKVMPGQPTLLWSKQAAESQDHSWWWKVNSLARSSISLQPSQASTVQPKPWLQAKTFSPTSSTKKPSEPVIWYPPQLSLNKSTTVSIVVKTVLSNCSLPLVKWRKMSASQPHLIFQTLKSYFVPSSPLVSAKHSSFARNGVSLSKWSQSEKETKSEQCQVVDLFRDKSGWWLPLMMFWPQHAPKFCSQSSTHGRPSSHT